MNHTIRKLKQMFSSGKEARIKAAFSAIKHDIKGLEQDNRTLDTHHEALKESTNEWIIHLHQENQVLRDRLEELELKVESMKHVNDKHHEEAVSVLELI